MKRYATVALACALAACARTAPATTQGGEAIARANPASSSDGGRVYVTNCSSCHGLDGKGLSGEFPALAANPAVTGNPRKAIATVLFGRRAGARDDSERFNGEMPAWRGLLSDDDIAAVVTYIRFAWHNHAAPVSAADVDAISSR